jgi:hypothetical protein
MTSCFRLDCLVRAFYTPQLIYKIAKKEPATQKANATTPKASKSVESLTKTMGGVKLAPKSV